ncbi:MAG: prepilin peptidase [Cyanobacteriota/Melainabacteria group bacterium]
MLQFSDINIFLSAEQYALARAVLVVVLGICVGSFLNVVALRSLKEQSWIFKKSHCPSCEHHLGVLDLIPILSYLLLKGRCRHCNTVISWQYPVVEAFTGLMFYLIFNFFGLTIHGLAMAFFGCVLIAVCITDFREKLIPHEITYPAMLIGIAYRSFFMLDRADPNAQHHFGNLFAQKAPGITFSLLYTQQTLEYIGFHQDIFMNTLAGIGISYIVFDYIDFYGLMMLKFLRGDEEEEEEEEEEKKDTETETETEEPDSEPQEDIAEVQSELATELETESETESEEEPREKAESPQKSEEKSDDYDDEEDIVMGGGDAVLSAVIASWLGLSGMVIAVTLAFLVGSLMGAVYLFVDMQRRKVLHTVAKPFGIGFAVGALLLSMPLIAFGSLTGNMAPWLSPQMATLALSGGVAGGLISAVFAGSRFQARFPFGPALAIGAAFAMFINVPGGLQSLMGIFHLTASFQ